MTVQVTIPSPRPSPPTRPAQDTLRHMPEGKHTIVLVQPTRNRETRTFSDYDTVPPSAPDVAALRPPCVVVCVTGPPGRTSAPCPNPRVAVPGPRARIAHPCQPRQVPQAMDGICHMFEMQLHSANPRCASPPPPWLVHSPTSHSPLAPCSLAHRARLPVALVARTAPPLPQHRQHRVRHPGPDELS